jgi:levanase/levanbiose-producing levanase
MHNSPATACPEPEAAAPDEVGLNRPVLHYTARDTWLNDPNGLIHNNGIYHLYYQNNPYGNVWGNMSWGHASSPDLISWTEHPLALAGDEEEDVFSGSIVIDHMNTSGFGSNDCPPWVAIYTSAFKDASPHRGTQAQSLAYSLDEGMTWTKFRGNPVLTRDSENFRDPKVFWYSGPKRSYWVMVAVEALDQMVLIYKSSNLKEWTLLSDFGPANATGGEWECPDLFPLPLDDNPDKNPEKTKWILTVNINPGAIAGGSGGQYFIGHFDGVHFTQDEPIQDRQAETSIPNESLRKYNWLDWGRDYYAAVSFSNVPDNRRIMIGWMNNWDYANQIPSSPWRSAMSLAREITLKTIDGRPVLMQKPILPRPHPLSPTHRIADAVELQDTPLTFPVTSDAKALIIRAEFLTATARRVGLRLRGTESELAGDAGNFTEICYDSASGELLVDRTNSGDTGFHPLFASVESCPLPLHDGLLSLEVIVDSCSVEVFAQNGQAAITDLIFPSVDGYSLSAFAEGGHATLKSIAITEIR